MGARLRACSRVRLVGPSSALRAEATTFALRAASPVAAATNAAARNSPLFAPPVSVRVVAMSPFEAASIRFHASFARGRLAKSTPRMLPSTGGSGSTTFATVTDLRAAVMSGPFAFDATRLTA